MADGETVDRDASRQDGEAFSGSIDRLPPPDELASFLVEVADVADMAADEAAQGVLDIAFDAIRELAIDDPASAVAHVRALMRTPSAELQIRSALSVMWVAAADQELARATWRTVRDENPDAFFESGVMIQDRLAERRGSSLPQGAAGVAAVKFYWDEIRPYI